MIGNCAYANAEITKVYLTKWNTNIIPFYSPNTTGVWNNEISGFTGLTECWSEIPLNTASVLYSQSLNAKNPAGITFTETITISIPNADLAKWNDLETLLANRYVIIFGDANGAFWCLGHKFGLEILTYKREENQFIIEFSSNSSVPLLVSIKENYIA